MNTTNYNKLFSFIWNIATDVLVYAFEKGEYKKIILPMMVLRRIDVLLEPTKKKTLEMKEALNVAHINNQEALLCNCTGYPFYNVSKFTLKTLRSETDPLRLKMNFTDYLNGFSKDVQDIIDKFRLRQMVDNLTEAERLGSIIEKFTDDKINLSNLPVLDDDGNEILPALDNHTMGTIFEELLRKFNEENNVTEAGEHFTPRDYVRLLADLAVLPVADQITDNTYRVYDGACGTGGILTIAQERMREIAAEHGKNVEVQIYGQELQPETYATCKADLMVSGDIKSFQYPVGQVMREYIAFDSTVSRDGHTGEHFDFLISNPPFGTPWKEDLKKRGLGEKDKDKFIDSRFSVTMPDGKVLSFLPDIGDCQMLFLANNISKMTHDTPLGSRIVEVHNGSSLFTGDAGGGASNLRQYIIENDMLEAIIAMPEKDFYNTGIGTHIWVVTNRKEERRKGLVQLIDATEIKTPLRKNLGEKNCETNEQDRAQIMKLYLDFAYTPQSKIFPNNEFGYWSVNVLRPLRWKAQITNDRIALCCQDSKYADMQDWLSRCLEATEGKEYMDYAAFIQCIEVVSKKLNIKLKKKNYDALDKYFTSVDTQAEIVRDAKGNPVPNKALTDSEQIPFRYPDGIKGFYEKEILPYTPDAWIDESSIKTGYELSFTKYFYKPVQLRSIQDIANDILGIEQNLDGKLSEMIAQVVTKGINPNVPMKDSGISWIGQIPEHWERRRFASICTVKSISNCENEELLSVYLDKGVIRFLEEDGKRTNPTSKDLSKYQLVEPGDFVMNNQQAWRGSVGVSRYRGIISPAYFVFQVTSELASDFANLLFRSKQYVAYYYICSKGIGSIQRNLDWDILKQQYIFIPPLEEQKAIVEYINTKCQSIDSMISNLESEIAYLKEYKQSLIADAVTGAINVQ